MTELLARFDVVAFDPSTVPGIQGEWLEASVLRKAFTEGVLGESVVHFVWSGDEANRAYLAVERITGTVAGVEGELTVQHWGTRFGDQTSAGGVVVTGSGTGAFIGWAGAALIEHDDRGPYFRFTLE